MQHQYGFDYTTLPKLPSLQEVLGTDPAARAPNIKKAIMTPQGQMMSALPGIQELLMGTQAPAVQALREGARANVAATQSDMMRRGLTGSDIEASAMIGARAQGEQQVGQLMAQQASVLAQYIMRALGMDIEANQTQFLTLAQALGQELQMEQEADMFRRSLEEGSAASGRSSLAAKQGATIGLIGNVLGGLARREY